MQNKILRNIGIRLCPFFVGGDDEDGRETSAAKKVHFAAKETTPQPVSEDSRGCSIRSFVSSISSEKEE